MLLRTLLLAVFVFSAGCDAKPGPEPPVPRDWNAHPAVVTMNGTHEIDALGDIHGDVEVAIRVLSSAGLITSAAPFRWTGGSTTLIVLGDVIDKGDRALPTIDLLITLETQAREVGGAVVVTLGNHEAEFLADPSSSKSAAFQAELLAAGFDPVDVAAGTSIYGTWLLNRPVAALVDGWFFCHAGNSDGKSAAKIANKFRGLFETATADGAPAVFSDSFLAGSNSLLEANLWWTSDVDSVETIDADLSALPAKHIVFGHDPGEIDFPDDPHGQRSKGKMVMRYDGRLFLVDVGMSSAVGYSDGALLRISRDGEDRAAVIYPDGDMKSLWP